MSPCSLFYSSKQAPILIALISFHLLYLWQESSQLVVFLFLQYLMVRCFKLHADKSINHSHMRFALVSCSLKNEVTVH